MDHHIDAIKHQEGREEAITPIAFDDVFVDKVQPDEKNLVLDTMMPLDGEVVAIDDYRESMEMLLKLGFIRAIRAKGQDGNFKLVGAVAIGEDATSETAYTLSYSRLPGVKDGGGAITIGVMKMAAALTQKIGMLSVTERIQLRAEGKWDKHKSDQQQKIDQNPIRAYVLPFNIKSRRLLERIGFKEKGLGTDIHNKDLQYELDIDAFDESWQRYSNAQDTSMAKKAA